MKLYPAEALVKLGFQPVRLALQQACCTPQGQDWAAQLLPHDTPEAASAAQHLAEDFRALWVRLGTLPLPVGPDVLPILRAVAPEGATLPLEHAARLSRWLHRVAELMAFLENHTEAQPGLSRLLHPLQDYDTRLTQVLDQVVDPDGELRPDASPELVRLRQAQAQATRAIRRVLEERLHHAQAQGWTDAPELAIRMGRLVVPLAAGRQHLMPGLVHDLSATGQTVYLEPLEVVNLNNELQTLRSQEAHEIARILQELALHVRAAMPQLQAYLQFWIAYDCAQAGGQLGTQMEGQATRWSGTGQMKLTDARHPALILQMGYAQVQPLSLALGPDQRMVVVSGPNAGGKSVALTTLGLVQVMAQCGLLVPCHPESRLSWVEKLFVDLGDDQNLAQNLSTYTSHLAHMQLLLAHGNDASLFLIDEIGNGTDPQLGSAVAEAILNRLLVQGARGVVTTHLPGLKVWAQQTPGVTNAAMAVDPLTLQPSFSLVAGLPGASYTLEVARRVGLPPEVVADAQLRAGQMSARAEELMARLEAERAQVQRLNQEAQQQRQAAEEARLRYQKAEKELAAHKRNALDAARTQAQKLVAQVRQRAEEWEKNYTQPQPQAPRPKLKELTQALQVFEEAAVPPVKKAEPVQPEVPVALTPGQHVRLEDGASVGVLLEREGDKAVVAFGELRLTVPVAELVPLPGRAETTRAKPKKSAATAPTTLEASLQLNVRGMRVDEALAEVDRFLDKALLANLPSVTILHGKGTGALRQAIRLHIRQLYKQVKGVADGPADGGGAGLTIVSF